MRQFHYSSLAYHLLSIILEQVYAKPFPDILQEKICGPLRMADTFSELSNQVVHERIAEPYDKVKGKWERNTFIDLALGRRIFSTTDDLYIWGRALADSSFLGERAYRLLSTNHVGSIDTTASYGYGIGVFEGVKHARGDLYLNRRYLIHGGFTDGYKAMFVVMQGDEGYIFTMLANTGTQIDEYEFARKVMKILVDE
jgi:CubicO group peptidase (beta-lactamase class C family)